MRLFRQTRTEAAMQLSNQQVSGPLHSDLPIDEWVARTFNRHSRAETQERERARRQADFVRLQRGQLQ